jgi:hypothetical protein
MAGFPRERTLSRGFEEGFLIYVPTGEETLVNTNLGYSHCIDTVGNHDYANGLEINHHTLVPGKISGQEAVWPVYGFRDYPYSNQPKADYAPGWDFGRPSNSDSITQLLAWTNPSRPEVSMLNFIAELRDLPRMLYEKGLEHQRDRRATLDAQRRRTGKYDKRSRQWVDHPDTFERSGNSVAEYNFGWQLLFADVQKILLFSQHVEKRVKELETLYKTGLHRQRVLWSSSQQTTSTVTFNSFVCGVEGERTTKTFARQWASCVWRPLSQDPAIPSRPDLRAKAMGLVHGWRVDPYVVWEALPWSWFFDYFVNVGDLLAATQNMVEFFPTDCCVMTHIRSTISDRITFCSDGFTCTPGRYVFEQKFRALSSIGINVTLPFLSGKQLTTLLGIAANVGSV